MFGMLGMIDLPKWVGNLPLTSNQMMLIGGGLLALLVLWTATRRRTAMKLQSSVVTEELMVYLARIANALERPQPLPPSAEEITAEVMRRLETMASTKPEGNVRQVMNSMFGREYRRE